MKRTFSILLALFLAGASVFAQAADDYLIYSDDAYADKMAALGSSQDEKNAVVYSSSSINWTKTTFSSEVNLNLGRAGIPMPSGKSSAVNKIQMELPSLIKDPLLSIYVDDLQSVGDLVLSGTFTLEQLSRIIADGKQTPAFFAENGNDLKISHTINLEDIDPSKHSWAEQFPDINARFEKVCNIYNGKTTSEKESYDQTYLNKSDKGCRIYLDSSMPSILA